MAMTGIRVELTNRAEIMEMLGQLEGEKVKTAVRRAMSDLKRRGPTIIARLAAQTYAISATKLNPNTKAGAGKATVQVSGNIIDAISWTYKGSRLALGGGKGAQGSFKLLPRSGPAPGRRYRTRTEILKGNTVEIGHGGPPHSEGGAYGAKSPWMVLPGQSTAMQRLGEGLGDIAKGLSVPQMVLSIRTKDELQMQLEELLRERVEHAIESVL